VTRQNKQGNVNFNRDLTGKNVHKKNSRRNTVGPRPLPAIRRTISVAIYKGFSNRYPISPHKLHFLDRKEGQLARVERKFFRTHGAIVDWVPRGIRDKSWETRKLPTNQGTNVRNLPKLVKGRGN
jgi:hypothetical protein